MITKVPCRLIPNTLGPSPWLFRGQGNKNGGIGAAGRQEVELGTLSCVNFSLLLA